MPAPDAAPAPDAPRLSRPLAVHLIPAMVDPAALASAIVIMIDALRASVTIAHALAHGCPVVHPTATVDEARALADTLRAAGQHPLLGGERAGVLIDGFDLDNSPWRYTRDAIASRPLVFTTTNGTAALLHARHADLILVGSFVNLSAVCSAVASDRRPVHILCAGTRGEVSLDDCLPAGAIADQLVLAGRELATDDSARLCIEAFRHARQRAADPDTGILQAMRESRGGRNLIRLSLNDDIVQCSRRDTLNIIPVFNPADRTIRTLAEPATEIAP